jgi:hypothetical protein
MKTTTSRQSRMLTPRLMQFLCVVLMFAAGRSVFALPQLVAYWKFDEPSGATTASDSAGSNTGMLSPAGASIDGNGISGNTLTLGANGFVNMGKVLQFPAGPFSISAWIMTTSPTACSLIVSTNMSGTDSGYILGANACGTKLGKANQAFFNLNGNAESAATPLSTRNINDGSWHHIVGVYDSGSGNMFVYVDGVPASKPIPPITPNYDPNNAFVIGGEMSGNQPFGSFNGSIDEVQIYNGVLSQADVTDLFTNQPKATEAPNHRLPMARSIFYYLWDHGTVVWGVMALMGLTLVVLRRRLKPA